jgi:hypothetical protein
MRVTFRTRAVSLFVVALIPESEKLSDSLELMQFAYKNPFVDYIDRITTEVASTAQ